MSDRHILETAVNFQNTSRSHRTNSCMCKMWLLTTLLKKHQQASSAIQDKAALGYNKVRRAIPLYYLAITAPVAPVPGGSFLHSQAKLLVQEFTAWYLIHLTVWVYLQKRQCPALDITSSSPLGWGSHWDDVRWKGRHGFLNNVFCKGRGCQLPKRQVPSNYNKLVLRK